MLIVLGFKLKSNSEHLFIQRWSLQLKISIAFFDIC